MKILRDLLLATGLLLPACVLSAEAITGETEHFVYRIPAADEPYVDTQRDNRAFAFLGTKIMLSEDCGKTWPHVADFPEARTSHSACC